MRIWYLDEAELAAAGTPWNTSMRGDWPGISTFLRVGADVYHSYSPLRSDPHGVNVLSKILALVTVL